MAWSTRILLICLITVRPGSTRSTFSKTELDSERRGKFLFNIIKFRNDPCNVTTSTSSDYDEQGVCFTSHECSRRGGQNRGSCAAGFGTCCFFESSCHGVQDQKVTYFRNPSFPKVDLATNYCTYGLKVTDPDVCQVRLDFDVFKMASPSMNFAPFGKCSSDRMAIFASQNQLGLSEGNLICGDMTGQHMYLPMDATNGEDNVSLFAMVGTSSLIGNSLTLIQNYTWSIRIEQIDCTTENELQAPAGCLQYFNTPTGSIQSFNYNDPESPYPINLDYAICIKRQPGFCGITFSTAAVGDGFGLNYKEVTVNNVREKSCYDPYGNDTNYSNDFLTLMGAISSNGTDKAVTPFLCGVFFGDIQFPTVTSSFLGPIVLRFHSDDSLRLLGNNSPAPNSQTAATQLRLGVERGFQLSYSVSPNCNYYKK